MNWIQLELESFARLTSSSEIKTTERTIHKEKRNSTLFSLAECLARDRINERIKNDLKKNTEEEEKFYNN